MIGFYFQNMNNKISSSIILNFRKLSFLLVSFCLVVFYSVNHMQTRSEYNNFHAIASDINQSNFTPDTWMLDDLGTVDLLGNKIYNLYLFGDIFIEINNQETLLDQNNACISFDIINGNFKSAQISFIKTDKLPSNSINCNLDGESSYPIIEKDMVYIYTTKTDDVFIPFYNDGKNINFDNDGVNSLSSLFSYVGDENVVFYLPIEDNHDTNSISIVFPSYNFENIMKKFSKSGRGETNKRTTI